MRPPLSSISYRVKGAWPPVQSLGVVFGRGRSPVHPYDMWSLMLCGCGKVTVIDGCSSLPARSRGSSRAESALASSVVFSRTRKRSKVREGE